MNMPSRHPLNHSQRGAAMIRQSDVILALEPMDLFGTLNNVDDLIGRPAQPKIRAGVKVIVLGTTDTNIKPNMGEYERYQAADFGIAGDAEASLPWLIQALEKEMNPARKSMASARGAKLKEAGGKFLQAAHEEAAMGWDASPISTARLSAELWNHIKGEDWTLTSEVNFLSNWPYRLWSMEKHYNSMGGSVGGGLWFNRPAALGPALADNGTGRLTVSRQTHGSRP